MAIGRPSPYLPGSEAYVTLSRQRHVVRVEVVLADGTTTDLEVSSCGVSFDEERAPRIRATVETALPDEATVSKLDPRLPIRLRVFAGYVRHDLPGAPVDVRTLMDGILTERAVNRPTNTLRLVAESDEATVVAAAHMSGGTITATTVRDAIQQLINGALSPDPAYVVSGSAGGSVSLPCTDTDRWQNIDDLADRINADVWVDESRVWHIEPRTNSTAAPHVDLTTGETGPGTVLSSSTMTERRGRFANRIHTVYEWRDAAGAQQRIVGVGYVTTGPLAYTPENPVILEVRRSVPTTQTDANTAARNIAARTVTRGRGHECEAVACYWLRPGHTARVTLDTGAPELQLVTSVDFDLLAGTMSVRTRVADTNITTT